tara:strand:+ start:9111 stop:9305 length:195 start_codon:yes stop_codon:yes gene_type:complete
MKNIILGKDQELWKTCYGDIELGKWRLEKISKNETDWVYIGDSIDNHWERKDNLLKNKYHYWPK